MDTKSARANRPQTSDEIKRYSLDETRDVDERITGSAEANKSKGDRGPPMWKRARRGDGVVEKIKKKRNEKK